MAMRAWAGVLFLGESWPSPVSLTGAMLIVVGMLLYSRISQSAEMEPVEG
ncbi:hypothetical protein [Archangium lipolyticum]|nr:hypothetical protein [Archangium lipolyticum]